MFDSKHRLSAIEARLHELEKTVGDLRVQLAELDPGALENLRRSVLNALRSLRRVDEASRDRQLEIEAPEASQDEISRLAIERRKRVIPRTQQG